MKSEQLLLGSSSTNFDSFGTLILSNGTEVAKRMKNPQRIRRNRERRGGFSGKSNTTNNISKWLGSIPTPTKNLS